MSLAASALPWASGAAPAPQRPILAQHPMSRPPSTAAAARRSLHCFGPRSTLYRRPARYYHITHTLSTTRTLRTACVGAEWGFGEVTACIVSSGAVASARESVRRCAMAYITNTTSISPHPVNPNVPHLRRNLTSVMRRRPVSQGGPCHRLLCLLTPPRRGPLPSPPRGTARLRRWLGGGPYIAIVYKNRANDFKTTMRTT